MFKRLTYIYLYVYFCMYVCSSAFETSTFVQIHKFQCRAYFALPFSFTLIVIVACLLIIKHIFNDLHLPMLHLNDFSHKPNCIHKHMYVCRIYHIKISQCTYEYNSTLQGGTIHIKDIWRLTMAEWQKIGYLIILKLNRAWRNANNRNNICMHVCICVSVNYV